MDDATGDLALRSLIGLGRRGAVWRAERRGAPGRVLAVKIVDTPSPVSLRDPGGDGTRVVEASTRSGPDRTRPPHHRELDRIVTQLREAAAALRGTAHPALLSIDDVEVVRDRIAVVMPYVAGGSLHDVLVARAGGRLPPDAVARLGADLASALAASHATGLRHGDLSSHDILFDVDGQVLLGGVGFADALRPSGPHPAEPSVEARGDDVRALARLLAGIVEDDERLGSSRLRELLGAATASPEDDPADDADRPTDAAFLAARLQTLRDTLPAPRSTAAQQRPRPASSLEATPANGATGATRASPEVAGPIRTASTGDLGWTRLVGRGSRPGPDVRPPGLVMRLHPRAARDRPARGGLASRRRPATARRRPVRGEPSRPLAWIGTAAAAIVILTLAVAAGHDARSTPGPAARHVDADEGAAAPAAPAVTDAPADAAPTPLAATPTGRDPATGAPSVFRAPPEPCPGVALPPLDGRTGSGQQLIGVDLEARGCGMPVSYDRGQLRTVSPAGHVERLAVTGVAADAVLLAGDWDCDGHEGIALYVPSSGETLRFDRLPEPGEEVRAVTEPTGVLHGAASVRVDADGCAELVVGPP